MHVIKEKFRSEKKEERNTCKEREKQGKSIENKKKKELHFLCDLF